MIEIAGTIAGWGHRDDALGVRVDERSWLAAQPNRWQMVTATATVNVQVRAAQRTSAPGAVWSDRGLLVTVAAADLAIITIDGVDVPGRLERFGARVRVVLAAGYPAQIAETRVLQVGGLWLGTRIDLHVDRGRTFSGSELLVDLEADPTVNAFAAVTLRTVDQSGIRTSNPAPAAGLVGFTGSAGRPFST